MQKADLTEYSQLWVKEISVFRKFYKKPNYKNVD